MTGGDWISDFNKCLDAWDGKYIVTSPDIDGILSACLLADKFGAKLAGVYTTRYLILFDNYGAKEAKNALWLDHDVSEEGVQCMGQHLVDHSEKDKLPKRGANSFNPNNYFGQTWKNSFHGSSMKAGKRDKYPYATVHFLMTGLGIKSPSKYSQHFHVLAHADGSWATCVDYRLNTLTWKETMFQSQNSIVNELNSDYVDDSRNLQGHTKLIEILLDLGVKKTGSRSGNSSLIPKQWQDLQGKQSISFGKVNEKDPNKWFLKFVDILKFVSSITNWAMELPNTITEIHKGLTLELPNSNEIPVGGFDSFMFDEDIFSHAITGAQTMRFTKLISIDDKIRSYRQIPVQNSQTRLF